jgi:Polyketide cyclase / dehydrase and lipid transport
MAIYEATIPSAWPADDTFWYLATFSNAQEWDPGVLRAEALGPGPVRAGSRFRLTVPFLGRKLALTYQVSEFSRPERRVVLDASSPLLRARDVITVRPGGTFSLASLGTPATYASQASAVSYHAEVTLRGPLHLLDPVLSRGFGKVGDRAASSLRGVLAFPPSAALFWSPASSGRAATPS